jgi:O-antigen/teichoic acid export membrane protein
MKEHQSSYRQIFKATSLFGGVQVFNIIISIIKSKFVALLIGPAGMGIAGLLTSTTQFITSLTNFGLGVSSVKNVAAAAATGDELRISTIVTVLRKLVWFTGLLGMIVTAVLSPVLSKMTFGNHDYTFAFLWISITLFFQQITSGQMVVLQGLRKLNYLAKGNMSGSVIGLCISVPVYYIWRLDGIVPVIIISSVSSMLLSHYFSSKAGIKSVPIKTREVVSEGKDMLKMGFILSLNGITVVGVSYLVRIFISRTGGIEQVGLYTAGFAIITTYVGMVFSAMSTDYYPRLSAVAHDNKAASGLINQQAVVAILILAPILSFFLIFINFIVIILYSQKFIAVNEMIHWAALGMYFKAASWSIGFILLAKGASRTFLWNELLGNAYILGFNLAGYKLAGLEGLGISFMTAYFVYFIQVFLLAKFKYQFAFDRVFFKVAGFQLMIGLLCFAIVRTLVAPWTYICGSILVVISGLFSLMELEKRIGIKDLIQSRFNIFKKPSE